MLRLAALIAVPASLLLASARADSADLLFDVRASDLTGASVQDGMVLLQLTACKTVEFHRLTQSTVGKPLAVHFEGVPVLRAHIREAMRGGRIVFSSSDERVLSKLTNLAAPQQKADSDLASCPASPMPAQ